MTIPSPVMAVAVDVLTETYTWAQLDVLFAGAGAPGDSPLGTSKAARSMAWFRRVNAEMPESALDFLGRLLHSFMEEVLPGEESWTDALEGFAPHPAGERDRSRARMKMALERAGLSYLQGGFVSQGGAHVAVRQLHNQIRSRNLPAIEAELESLAKGAAIHPRDALSAAANIVEAVLGEMIAAYGLTPPANRTLNTLWATLKPVINADPEMMPDPDLRKIAGAMAALVDGLQGLRDDKSRAHAMRPELARAYRIEPRHARLAVNAALALVVFLLEIWEAQRGRA